LFIVQNIQGIFLEDIKMEPRPYATAVASQWHSNPLSLPNAQSLPAASSLTTLLDQQCSVADNYRHLSIDILTDRTFFLAGHDSISGYIQWSCSNNSKHRLKILFIQVELTGVEEAARKLIDKKSAVNSPINASPVDIHSTDPLNDRFSSPPKTDITTGRRVLLNRVLILQAPHLPPSQAVLAEHGSDDGHWAARKGYMQFPFVFELPDDLPSSFDDFPWSATIGSVRYYLTVYVHFAIFVNFCQFLLLLMVQDRSLKMREKRYSCPETARYYDLSAVENTRIAFACI
jgi:hypothetical protein